ncbi:MAG: inorganic phosphate transporter [Acidobacteria bacterium]|nr:inorganic phosphate transporter [Acidobacteriota bacterium]
MIGLLLGATLLLAFVNGANDNFKGVATLYGSGVLSYRAALALAAGSTAAGSLSSVALASGLAEAFSAKGLVPDAILTPSFLAAAGIASALTVLAATRLGLPVSTTHALVGGLVGAGFVTAGKALNLAALGAVFVLPLLVSPLIATPLAWAGYRAGRLGRQRLRVEAESCVCIGEEWVPMGSASACVAATGLTVSVATVPQCERRYLGRVLGVSAQTIATSTHVASASLVGFARGLNDTPKILGLIVGASALSPWLGTLAISAAMLLGSVLAGRRVADTLASKVTSMNQGQGLAANLSAAILITAASRLGLPVSTTHVSTGSIIGIGVAGNDLRWKMVGAIFAAWVTTLPLAAALGATGMWALR